LLETGDTEEFFKTVDRIRELLHIYDNEPLLLRTLLYWLVQYLQSHGMVEETSVILSTIEKPQEAGTMLSRTLEKIKKDLRKEGFNQGVQIGMIKGKREGVKEGIQKGIQKGLQKGLKQGITTEKQKIALAMLQKGIDKCTIMEVTKLTKTQLEQLEKK